MLVSAISPQQYSDFVAIERTCSALSLVSCVFIISTFLGSESFRKPITRLVFFASFGNLLTNVATIMARTFVEAPTSVGCQLQAFLIQMFMPADAYWTLAMAFNVYLTFYRKYDADMLKRMEMLYLFICYGVPFIVALTYVFIYNPIQGRMYGNALLWCWVSSEWDIWRIATFYAPVWVAIFITFFIYIRTGRQVYRKYRQLRSLTFQPSSRLGETFTITEPFSMRTTEVCITSEVNPNIRLDDGTIANDPGAAVVRAPPAAAYSVTITSEAGRSGRSTPQREPEDVTAAYPVILKSNAGRTGRSTPPPHDHDETGEEFCHDVKSTVSSRGTGDVTSSTMNLRSSPAGTVASLANSRRRLTRTLSESFRPQSRRQLAVYEANNAAWSYAKCALLFFTALLITWIPSTANRVYSIARHGDVSVGLQYASAFVLPLQGFWNGLIYIFTTRKACGLMLARGLHCFSKKTPGTTDKRRARETLKADFSDRFGTHSETRAELWRQPSRDSDCFMLGAVPGKLDDRLNMGPRVNNERN